MVSSYENNNASRSDKCSTPKTTNKLIWNTEQADLFKNKLCNVNISHIERYLIQAESAKETVPLELINNIVGDVCDMLKGAASDSGMSKQ